MKELLERTQYESAYIFGIRKPCKSHISFHSFTNYEAKRCSHDANLVCNLESILLSRDHNVSLLSTIGGVKSVNFLDLNVVKFLASLLDGWLGSSSIDDKDESVLIFNSLDSAFGGKRILDDCVLVKGGLLLDTCFEVLRASLQGEGLRESEGNLVPNLGLSLGMSSFLNGSGHLLSYLYTSNA